MNAKRERSRSVWMDVRVAPDASALKADHAADIAIVGSGIAGLSIAYELAVRGLSVVVLDRGEIAGGMTSRTTAHLAPIFDDSLAELLSMRGQELAQCFQASQSAAVDRIEAIQEELGIDCEFRRLDGILFLDPRKRGERPRRRGFSGPRNRRHRRARKGLALARAGRPSVLAVPGSGDLPPVEVFAGCGISANREGARLHPDTAVVEVNEKDDRVELKLESGHTVTADHAVIATNSPIHDLVALHTKQAPYRTYAMGFEIELGKLDDALYWDTQDPYHYVRLRRGEDGKDIVIVGGEDHKTGEADDADARFAALTSWAKTLIPDLGPERYRWSGQVMDTLDYCGFIGREAGSKRVLVSTGDSGQGITHGVVASLLIPDLILGRENEFAAVYDPDRKPLKAATTYVSENITAIKNLAEYLAPGELSSIDELKPGQGAIVRRGLSKIAAYRTEKGDVIEKSAACTHLGCHLHWNSFEECWDCPCHGSHFAPDGSVLNAPAIGPLADVEASS
jgi:glycine/D-amino acid oxidase-like deaminating enzyme/nitrite reductase/ring-hydroxylating ferredoxin subunit